MQPEGLRAQADRYRDIARAMSRPDVIDALLDYAAECERRAVVLEQDRRRASARAVRTLIRAATRPAQISP